jgi:hypothetical protein
LSYRSVSAVNLTDDLFYLWLQRNISAHDGFNLIQFRLGLPTEFFRKREDRELGSCTIRREFRTGKSHSRAEALKWRWCVLMLTTCTWQARQGMSLIMERLRGYQALPNTLEAEESETTVSTDDQQRRPHSFYAERGTSRTTAFGSGSNNDEWEEYRPAAHRNKFSEKYTTGDPSSGSGRGEKSGASTPLPSSFFLATRPDTGSTMNQLYPSLRKRFRREEQQVYAHDRRSDINATRDFSLRNWEDSEQGNAEDGRR